MLSETTANYILGCSEFKKCVSHYKPKYCKFVKIKPSRNNEIRLSFTDVDKPLNCRENFRIL